MEIPFVHSSQLHKNPKDFESNAANQMWFLLHKNIEPFDWTVSAAAEYSSVVLLNPS